MSDEIIKGTIIRVEETPRPINRLQTVGRDHRQPGRAVV